MRKISALLAAVLLPVQLSAATETNFDAGTVTAAWLKQSTDARTAAMGGAGQGTATDINAIGTNAAGLTGIENQEFAFMHSALFEDMAIEHVAYGLKVGDAGALGLSFDYMNYGSIKSYTVTNGTLAEAGEVSPSGYSASLAYGHSLSDELSIGLAAKMVSENLDGSSAASSFAADLGAQYRLDGFGLGVSARNMGAQLNNHNLPTNVNAAISYGMPAGDSASVAVMVDANFPSFALDSSAYSFGAEITALENYSVRGGYKLIGNEGASGYSLGAGATWNMLTLNYAFVNQGDLGNSNQISLLTRF